MRARPHPRARRHPLGGPARLLMLLIVVVGFGVVASRSEVAPDFGPVHGDIAAAQSAVEALLDPATSADAAALLPPDFTSVTGTVVGSEPARDGTVRTVHLGGDCSAPWGEDSTHWDFGTPCRSHDLGYDLLRYAESKGHPLPTDMREALDDRLSADMHGTCEVNPRGARSLCEGVAALYTAGLVVNSWHERWGPPLGEPVSPLIAGVLVIGVLLWHRLRDRFQTVRHDRPARPVGTGTTERVEASPSGRWTLVGVAAVAVLVLGESAVALAHWAGVSPEWLWPLTWPVRTTVVFFFAAGHINAGGWLAVARSGGGCREYLVRRSSWLFRLTLVFAVVAFAVPLALELLAIPPSTIEAVVRIALHPLWLLGLYVLTVILTPAMLALHRRAPRLAPTTLAVLLAATVWAHGVTEAGWTEHGGALLVALLAQQAAFAHRDGLLPTRPQFAVLSGVALAAVAAGVATGALPNAALGVTDAPPELAGPITTVLLLGTAQLAALGLFRTRLRRVRADSGVLRAAAFAGRAPMTLYLVFLAAVLLLVAAVYLPRRLGPDPGVLLQPRALLALAFLAGPAVVVFRWFERQGRRGPPLVLDWGPSQGGLDRVLSHAGTVAGFGFAFLGVFGFALTSLNAEPPGLSPLLLDPVQSLVHLLLGMALLHGVHTRSMGTPGIWLLTTVACVPPLLSVTSAPSPDALSLALHLGTAVLATAAAATTVVTALTSPTRGFKAETT